jgi:ABC-type transport system involved in multi-copper enzyme maturation permease subunit
LDESAQATPSAHAFGAFRIQKRTLNRILFQSRSSSALQIDVEPAEHFFPNFRVPVGRFAPADEALVAHGDGRKKMAILVTSLIVQIEYRNNAWKQVNTLPLSLTTIYFSKLAVVLVMMAEFFILFDVAVYVSAIVPATLLGNVSYPRAHLPLGAFVADTGHYWMASLPIVVAQYVLSLRFRNFLVPVGVGFLTWVGALSALSWKGGYILPYTYTMLAYLRDDPKT